jgi:HK97 gp10 family phage protein
MLLQVIEIMKTNVKITGMDKLYKSLKRLGRIPQEHVDSSVKKAMDMPLKMAKAAAPHKKATGNLQRGIISVGENSRKKGKKVYRIVFDRDMNNIFQKPVKNVGESGSDEARNPAYYPIALEYGFFKRDGVYREGFKFVRNSFENSVPEIEKTIIKSMQKEIDKELAKGGLK